MKVALEGQGQVTLAAANVRIARNKERNIKRFIELIDEAAALGVNFLVFPELGLQGYVDLDLPRRSPEGIDERRRILHEAESIPGPATERLQEYSARHHMYIQFGLAEAALNGNLVFNSTVLIGPNGIVGVHRKVHNQFEYPYFAPGNSIRTFQTPSLSIGMAICYDMCFPEHVRICALQGADVVLASTAWPMKGHEPTDDYNGRVLDLVVRANAFFNQLWVVVSNHCEKGAYSGGVDYYGRSQIVHPCGDVVASLDDEEGLATHTADLKNELLTARTRDFFTHNLLRDRRVELYGPLTDKSQYESSYPEHESDGEQNASHLLPRRPPANTER